MSQLDLIRQIHPYLSETALSNLYTMGVATPHSPKQAIGNPYQIPPTEVRKLRASLILEEALETIKALGLVVVLRASSMNPIAIHICKFEESTQKPNLELIIDGCCDLNYVAVGCLMSCGVPDVPHMNKVNTANNAKFPGGKPIIREDGKYLKPSNWIAPVHMEEGVMPPGTGYMINCQEVSKELVKVAQRPEAQ